MKQKSISVIVGLIVLGIVAVIVVDYLAGRPDRLGDNPYELDIEAYRDVDPGLITYKETKNFPVKGFAPGGIDVEDSIVWLCGEGMIQAFTQKGAIYREIPTEGKGEAILVDGDKIFIAFKDHVEVFDTDGSQKAVWEVPGKNCYFTSLAWKAPFLYVADAGNRSVLLYNEAGILQGKFEGKAESNAGHGFIVPSANFDLVVNSFGELWVVNPGKHALENYTDEGELRGFWQSSSMAIDGFTGCCNPAEIAVLEDGSFVTSEKKLVRIKIYDQSGKLKTVVAAPSEFEENGHAPEVCVDEQGRIFALDFDRSIVRVWEQE